jgi:hypothetical protein
MRKLSPFLPHGLQIWQSRYLSAIYEYNEFGLMARILKGIRSQLLKI